MLGTGGSCSRWRCWRWRGVGRRNEGWDLGFETQGVRGGRKCDDGDKGGINGGGVEDAADIEDGAAGRGQLERGVNGRLGVPLKAERGKGRGRMGSAALPTSCGDDRQRQLETRQGELYQKLNGGTWSLQRLDCCGLWKVLPQFTVEAASIDLSPCIP